MIPFVALAIGAALAGGAVVALATSPKRAGRDPAPKPPPKRYTGPRQIGLEKRPPTWNRKTAPPALIVQGSDAELVELLRWVAQQAHKTNAGEVAARAVAAYKITADAGQLYADAMSMALQHVGWFHYPNPRRVAEALATATAYRGRVAGDVAYMATSNAHSWQWRYEPMSKTTTARKLLAFMVYERMLGIEPTANAPGKSAAAWI